MILLQTARGEIELAPEQGGCVKAFRWDGLDVLRPLDPASGEDAPPAEYAAFPLFPFSGRIENGVFSFAGESYAIPPNFPPEPHAIHGQGWQSKWKVVEQTGLLAKLRMRYVGGHWPWAYEATQTFTLRDDGLRLDLALTNLSERAMPAGLGWHPYFPASDASLLADVSAVWLSGEDMIPSAPSPLDRATDLRSERRVADLHLDNGFSVGDVGTTITLGNPNVTVRMTSSDVLRHLIVYTPKGKDFFCVEPVSHSPNAINSTLPSEVSGLRVLQPEETLTGTIYLNVTT